MHVIVVGAGITGLATAWTLVEEGMDVTLVEQNEGPGRGASERNGAQLSYAYVAPMANWATLRSVPGMLLDRASPLRFRPGWSWPLWAWCLRFLAACNDAEARRSTLALLDLGALSREHFEQWRSGLEPGECIDFARNGKLVLMRDRASWTSARRQLALQSDWGPPQQLLDAAGCVALEPALSRQTDPLVGGVHTASESVADCGSVCVRLAQSLAGRCQMMWNAQALQWQVAGPRVDGLWVNHGDTYRTAELLRADAYVIANGVDAPKLLSPLGQRLPIAPLKGYSIELPEHVLQAFPQLSITDSARKVVFAPLGSGDDRRLRVAGMAELVADDRQIDPVRIEQLLQATTQIFGLRQPPTELKPWAGQRPMTPTGRPYIGPLKRAENVFVNVGQGSLGFTLAFGSAVVLMHELLGRPVPLRDRNAFRA